MAFGTASLANNSAVYLGCLTPGGDLKDVTIDVAPECKGNATFIQWNSEGSQGPQGPEGPTGDPGSPLPQTLYGVEQWVGPFVIGSDTNSHRVATDPYSGDCQQQLRDQRRSELGRVLELCQSRQPHLVHLAVRLHLRLGTQGSITFRH